MYRAKIAGELKEPREHVLQWLCDEPGSSVRCRVQGLSERATRPLDGSRGVLKNRSPLLAMPVIDVLSSPQFVVGGCWGHFGNHRS